MLAVVLRWGFNDASHFSRLFKHRFGICPREFAAGAHDGTYAAAGDAGDVCGLS
ncbi:helix-turn-helix domain-containing protein [Salinicola acroporae]|uniref:helix-turn-helix domain-containing protein n=1 Tax=Salinicola acroporae TaxID=1541440 RepID=UPI003B8488F1